MTTAVMSRAIVGHSGLPLVVSRRMTAVYVLVAVAALLRGVAEALPGTAWQVAISGAALLWIAAFALFVRDIWPMVNVPDGSGT